MKKTVLFWIPRIISILAIVFVVMFSLDVFGGNEPITKKLLAFLIHNIPALILIAALIIAWKRELIGGILFIVLFLVGCYFFKSFAGNPASLIVISPFLLVGILFILSSTRTKKIG
jgi:hypothetical protein